MNVMIELPLIIFTLLIQLGVGAILAVQILPPDTAKTLRGVSLYAFCFVGVAAIISMAHLGTPPRSNITMLHNFSWFSVQILTIFGLCICLGCLAFIQRRMPFHLWENTLAWLAVIIGLWLLFVMSQTYVSPFLPPWQQFSTLFLFCASTLILGSMWTGMTLAKTGLSGQGTIIPATYGRLLFMALAGLVLLATFIPLAMPVSATRSSAAMITSLPGISIWHSWHGALSGLGILVFMTGIYRRISRSGVNADLTIPGLPIMGLAFTLAMLGEICGRAAFYVSYAWQPM